MRLSLATYRLLFKHPFGTAHGLRNGTDSVFVRLCDNGHEGYGEATLPPYLNETQAHVFQELKGMDLVRQIDALRTGKDVSNETLSPPTRAALSTAYYDLISRQQGVSVSTLLTRGVGTGSPQGRAMVTLGHSSPHEIPAKLKELPRSAILKVKLGSDHDLETLGVVLGADERPLFLDANQGWMNVAQAMAAIGVVGGARLVGLEQPFAKDRLDLHKELRDEGAGALFADESVQDMADLERSVEAFTGVNVKLMKCGGLDRAFAMINRARELGMAVMLGSMSESSLGCGAMAQLAGSADLLDLDGPWLIANDPFMGLGMTEDGLTVEEPFGVGIRPSDKVLDWINVGA
ncbi:MAG: enolase C-terminal domain-like protein [Flavobacteriales bacterium]